MESMLKRQLKDWQRTFREKHGRDPSRKDMASHPDIATVYDTWHAIKSCAPPSKPVARAKAVDKPERGLPSSSYQAPPAAKKPRLNPPTACSKADAQQLEPRRPPTTPTAKHRERLAAAAHPGQASRPCPPTPRSNPFRSPGQPPLPPSIHAAPSKDALTPSRSRRNPFQTPVKHASARTPDSARSVVIVPRSPARPRSTDASVAQDGAYGGFDDASSPSRLRRLIESQSRWTPRRRSAQQRAGLEAELALRESLTPRTRARKRLKGESVPPTPADEREAKRRGGQRDVAAARNARGGRPGGLTAVLQQIAATKGATPPTLGNPHVSPPLDSKSGHSLAPKAQSGVGAECSRSLVVPRNIEAADDDSDEAGGEEDIVGPSPSMATKRMAARTRFQGLFDGVDGGGSGSGAVPVPALTFPSTNGGDANGANAASSTAADGIPTLPWAGMDEEGGPRGSDWDEEQQEDAIMAELMDDEAMRRAERELRNELSTRRRGQSTGGGGADQRCISLAWARTEAGLGPSSSSSVEEGEEGRRQRQSATREDDAEVVIRAYRRYAPPPTAPARHEKHATSAEFPNAVLMDSEAPRQQRSGGEEDDDEQDEDDDYVMGAYTRLLLRLQTERQHPQPPASAPPAKHAGGSRAEEGCVPGELDSATASLRLASPRGMRARRAMAARRRERLRGLLGDEGGLEMLRLEDEVGSTAQGTGDPTAGAGGRRGGAAAHGASSQRGGSGNGAAARPSWGEAKRREKLESLRAGEHGGWTKGEARKLAKAQQHLLAEEERTRRLDDGARKRAQPGKPMARTGRAGLGEDEVGAGEATPPLDVSDGEEDELDNSAGAFLWDVEWPGGKEPGPSGSARRRPAVAAGDSDWESGVEESDEEYGLGDGEMDEWDVA